MFDRSQVYKDTNNPSWLAKYIQREQNMGICFSQEARLYIFSISFLVDNFTVQEINNLSCAFFFYTTIKKVKSLSHVQLFATTWTITYQVPPFMGFFRQEYWSGLPFPSPGDLPNPDIEPGSPAFQAVVLPSEPKPQVKLFSLAAFLEEIMFAEIVRQLFPSL